MLKSDDAVLRRMLRDELKARGLGDRNSPGYMTRDMKPDAA